MRVLVDGVVFENTYQIGIWRVFYEVMRRLADRVDYTLWLRSPAEQPIPPGVKVVQDSGRRYGARRNLVTWAKGKWARRFPCVAQFRAADLFHSTYFTPCPVPGPAVVTSVYDMIAELAYPYSGGGGFVSNIRAKRAAIDAARMCVAISAAAADDVVRFFPHTVGRVRVVPLAADHLLLASGEPVAAGQGTSALFVGQRDGYKNFVTVLEAMTSAGWPGRVRLRVIGSPIEEHEAGLIAYYGLTDRVDGVGRVTDKELAAEYAAAICFVFPSRLEGFGLPILEAQVNGCPVVCADTPVFHEVAGNGALFFDPRLGERLAEAVATACEAKVRNRLVETGHENVRRFSWDRAAEQILAVYQEAAQQASR